MPPPSNKANLLIAAGAEAFNGGQLAQAEKLFTRALKAQHNHPSARYGLGLVALQQGALAHAVKHFRTVIVSQPNMAQAHNFLGVALSRAGQHLAAIEAFAEALRLQPALAGAHNDLGCVYRTLGRAEDAMNCFRAAIRHDPRSAPAQENLGHLLSDQLRLEEAAACYQTVIQQHPQRANGYTCLAGTYYKMQRIPEALAQIETALTLDGSRRESHFWHGLVHIQLKATRAALEAFRRALVADPDHMHTLARVAFLERALCLWQEDADHVEQLRNYLTGDPTQSLPPLMLLSTDLASNLLRDNARRYLADLTRALPDPPEPETIHPLSDDRDGRLTVAYLSGDFRPHPVAELMTGLLRQHDRDAYRVLAYHSGPNPGAGDPIRQGIIDAVDQFADVAELPHTALADRIRADRVDILVELNGHTTHARLEALSLRPAPVQVTYLGYCGTTGADFIDYLIADSFVAPNATQADFSEQLVHLPDCFMIQDDRRIIAPPPTRFEVGLPHNGLVFFAFHQPYKISRPLFDLWLTLLQETSDSVLWLREYEAEATARLRDHASAARIDPDRLVFARREDDPDRHLGRHQLADLYLDTLPYNGHASTADALWAGLPVLTCAGTGFAARVAGSLLHAIGLPELVTNSPEAYQQMALTLAHDPALLGQYRQRLADNRSRLPLFDTARTTRHLERAYQMMWQRHRDGLPPAPLQVTPLD